MTYDYYDGFFGVLIESDWNLKYISLLLPVPRKAVLIESDWNLKAKRPIRNLPLMPVLIESDWNLKYTSGMKSYMLYRY